jgi:L-aspartate oxidase
VSAPVIVVGAGIAGLSVALAAAPRPVLLLCRSEGDGATPLAQGGIAAALAPGDSANAHIEDSLAAGAGCNDLAALRLLAFQAPSAVAWLASHGVDFDRDQFGHPRFAREGGHRCARVLHAEGDASGRAIARALVAAIRQAGHVQRLPGLELNALLRRDGRIVGVQARDAQGRTQRIEAGAVVLATGGIGALLACSSSPRGAEGGGLAAGLAAGALARDLEFLQFHPTALALPLVDGRLPLLTEALRGAGARLLDAQGRPLMDGIDPRGDLAARDVVARAVWRAGRRGAAVWLDARSLGDDLPRRFPTAFALCQARGIDPRRDPIPVQAAAHYHMGGLRTDLFGRSSLPGLYAAGEVACNGVHGANRLASNSLLEAVVFGRRLGRRLALGESADSPQGEAEIIERGPDLADLAPLRQLLWRSFGPERSGAGLRAGLEGIAADPLLAQSWQGRLATALLKAALARPHSLGAHWRSDVPPDHQRVARTLIPQLDAPESASGRSTGKA